MVQSPSASIRDLLGMRNKYPEETAKVKGVPHFTGSPFVSANSVQFFPDNSSKDLFDGLIPMRDILTEGIVE